MVTALLEQTRQIQRGSVMHLQLFLLRNSVSKCGNILAENSK